jgi:signal transduction histidine kinase
MHDQIFKYAPTGLVLFENQEKEGVTDSESWICVMSNPSSANLLSQSITTGQSLLETFDPTITSQLIANNTAEYFNSTNNTWLKLSAEKDSEKMVLSINDITDIKNKFLQEIRMTQMYKALSGSLSDNEIILFDQDFNIIFSEGQPAFIRIPEDTILGKNFKELIKGGKFSYLDTYIQKVFEVTRQDVEQEIEGMYYSCSMYSSMADEKTGHNSIGVILLKDVTEIKRKNAEIESLYQKILKSNQELEDFAYTASHDLQAPLRKIQSFGKLLKDRYASSLTGNGMQFLDRMIEAAQWMGTLLDALLSYSRATRSDAVYEKTNIRDILESVIIDLNIKESSETVRIEVEGDWPEMDVIPLQIQQLFRNLLENSLKFTKEKDNLLVNIKGNLLEDPQFMRENLRTSGPHLEIVFQDNGIGFEQEYADQIFQIFQRLHGRSEYSGSGVGLAICKKVVENHNGSITAQGELQNGATFTILLPIEQL